ncbi:MAG: hypothetical protein R2764_00390 [Bacteroidales bacterium]
MNTGENNLPHFEYDKDNFIQEDMIDVGSGSLSGFADYDGDGLEDLFISNYGYYMYSYYSAGMFLSPFIGRPLVCIRIPELPRNPN